MATSFPALYHDQIIRFCTQLHVFDFYHVNQLSRVRKASLQFPHKLLITYYLYPEIGYM